MSTEPETLEVLDADHIRQAANLPATADTLLPAPVERVVTALADRDWDGVEDGHIGQTVTPRLPRLLLNRKVDGGFVDELTGERFTDTTFVWLADTMTRAWWPLPFGKGNKEPDCRSRDGITADASAPAQQDDWSEPSSKEVRGVKPGTDKCAACPNAKWVDGEGSSCSSSVEVMVYLLDQQRLSVVRFGGMAVSRVNKYLGALEAHIPRKPPIAYVTRCTLEPVDTTNGTFLVPVFSPAGEIPRAEATPLIEMRREKVAEWQEQLAADLAEGATRDVETKSPGPFDSDSERAERLANEEPF